MNILLKIKTANFIRSLFCVVMLALVTTSMVVTKQVYADPIDPSAGVDFGKLEALLKGEGLEGWIHGAVNEQGLYVFTWRSPDDFFTSAQFPIVSHIPAVQEQLKGLKRHDHVRLKGQFLQNGAPQRHIYATQLVLVDSFDQSPEGSYDYSVEVPKDLAGKTELIAKVHIVDAGGSVLVIEYKDAVLPVFIKRTEDRAQVKDYYRGDKIKLHFKLRTFPDRPTHLEPAEDVGKAIELLEPLVDLHGKAGERKGVIVKFPRSPQVAFDVFALQTIDGDGVTLDYTLLNPEDTAVFEAIRKKLGDAFDAHADKAVNGRNKLVVPGLMVRASGIFNVISPSQANPQIYLKSADDVVITYEP